MANSYVLTTPSPSHKNNRCHVIIKVYPALSYPTSSPVRCIITGECKAPRASRGMFEQSRTSLHKHQTRELFIARMSSKPVNARLVTIRPLCLNTAIIQALLHCANSCWRFELPEQLSIELNCSDSHLSQVFGMNHSPNFNTDIQMIENYVGFVQPCLIETSLIIKFVLVRIPKWIWT